MFKWERWLFRERVTVSVSCYPHHNNWHWRDNGGRMPAHCYDTSLCIGPWAFSIVVWRLGALSWLVRWLPHNRGNGRGLIVGK